MSSSLTISIILVLAISRLCLADSPFPQIPEVASSPEGCLHREATGPYCWYILRNNLQVNGGLRMLSTVAGINTFSSIELSAGLNNQSRPINGGVWANGDVAYELSLVGNISLRITLHIPLFSNTCYSIKDGRWEIDFPASLSTTVEAPYLGSATGVNNVRATAVVHNNSIARLDLVAETLASGSFIESRCGLRVIITSLDLATWYYDAYASIDVAGERERYSVHYNNPNLYIFSGSLK